MIRSLQARLGMQLLLSLLVVFLLLWLLVSNVIKTMMEDYIVSRLEHDSETILAAVTVDESGNISVDISRIDVIYLRPFSGHYYQLTVGDRVLTSRSLWDQVIDDDNMSAEQDTVRYLDGPQQQLLLTVMKDYEKQSRTGYTVRQSHLGA